MLHLKSSRHYGQMTCGTELALPLPCIWSALRLALPLSDKDDKKTGYHFLFSQRTKGRAILLQATTGHLQIFQQLAHRFLSNSCKQWSSNLPDSSSWTPKFSSSAVSMASLPTSQQFFFLSITAIFSSLLNTFDSDVKKCEATSFAQ